MPPPLHIELTDEQAQELKQVRDSHPKAYLRERASAILKVAQGWSARQVGAQGLRKRHEPETLSLWVRQYVAEGVAGETRTRTKGRFSPQVKSGRPSRGQ